MKIARILTLVLVLVGSSLTLGDTATASVKTTQPENCCTYPVCPPNCF